MRLLIVLTLISGICMAQRPELSMNLFIHEGYSQILPFHNQKALKFKKLGIKKIKIQRSKKEYSILDINKNGFPKKQISYYKFKKNKFEPIDSTLYSYNQLNKIVTIKKFKNKIIETDSLLYDGKVLSGMFFKSNDFIDSDTCNGGLRTNFSLIETNNGIKKFKSINCNDTIFLYLDSLNNFIKQISNNYLDSILTSNDTMFYWQKQSKKSLELLRTSIFKKNKLIKELVKSYESNKTLTTEFTYNSKNQLVSKVTNGNNTSEFFTYYPNGLLKNQILLYPDPQWKYNFFLGSQEEKFDTPILKYSYQTKDGKWINKQ